MRAQTPCAHPPLLPRRATPHTSTQIQTRAQDTEHREFKAWQWKRLEDLPGSVVEFKREVYEQVSVG